MRGGEKTGQGPPSSLQPLIVPGIVGDVLRRRQRPTASARPHRMPANATRIGGDRLAFAEYLFPAKHTSKDRLRTLLNDGRQNARSRTLVLSSGHGSSPRAVGHRGFATRKSSRRGRPESV